MKRFFAMLVAALAMICVATACDDEPEVVPEVKKFLELSPVTIKATDVAAEYSFTVKASHPWTAPGSYFGPRFGAQCPERGREEAGCRRVLASLYWEGPSELPHRRSSSSAPRRDSTEPRPRGCSVLGEPPQALPSF